MLNIVQLELTCAITDFLPLVQLTCIMANQPVSKKTYIYVKYNEQMRNQY